MNLHRYVPYSILFLKRLQTTKFLIHFNSLPVLLILKGQGCSFLTQSSNSTSSSVSEQEKQKKSLKNERSQHAIITELNDKCSTLCVKPTFDSRSW